MPLIEVTDEIKQLLDDARLAWRIGLRLGGVQNPDPDYSAMILHAFTINHQLTPQASHDESMANLLADPEGLAMVDRQLRDQARLVAARGQPEPPRESPTAQQSITHKQRET